MDANSLDEHNLRVVVLTYERPELLLNLVASVHRFLPGSSLHIIDDGSSSDAQRRLLARLSDGATVTIRDRNAVTSLGRLYDSMNSAVSGAEREGREWVLLLQDDLQVVRPAGPSMRSLMHAASSHPDVVMAGVAFDKWMYPSRRTRCTDCDGSFPKMSLFDVGLVNIRRMLEAGLCFGPNEIEANERAVEAGLRSYIDKNPFVAFVPWPERYRYSKPSGRFRPVRGFARFQEQLVRFLDSPDADPADVELLLRMGTITESALPDGSTRFFSELNVELNGWSALAPFGYGEPWGYLFRHFLRNLGRNDGRPIIWPRFTRSAFQREAAG